MNIVNNLNVRKPLKLMVLRMNVNIITVDDVVCLINTWLTKSLSGYICVANVHMCMEVFDNQNYREIINDSDLVVADGLPLVWAQRMLANKQAEQVRGQDLTLAICKDAEKSGHPVGFYGSTDVQLNLLKSKLEKEFPELNVVYSFSPPFRTATVDEDRLYVEEINKSGVKILFVGLGCPKQEIWMSEHKDRLSCIMLGVGAAFDFIAGNKKPAPKWMQKSGLEWLFRLLSEPKRLWKRYLKQNPRYIYYFVLQLLGRKYD